MSCTLHDKRYAPTGFYKAMERMGMDPGLEFKVALEEADKLNARYIALHTFHCLPVLVSCNALLLYEPCMAVGTASPYRINELGRTFMLTCLSWVFSSYCQA